MRWTPIAVTLLALSGCGKGEGEGDDFCAENPDHAACQTGTDSFVTDSTVPETFMVPVAVGFELMAHLNPDGTLTAPVYNDNDTPSPGDFPMLRLTFADESFFQSGRTPDNYCEIGVPVDLTPQDSTNPAFGTQTGNTPMATVLNWSYDFNLNLVDDGGYLSYYTFQEQDAVTGQVYSTACDGKLDPEQWGASGEILISAFHNAHIGLGFGQMTDYLLNALAKPTLTDWENSYFTQFVAVNDIDGHWGGCDWTFAVVLQTDPKTDMVIVDKDGFGIPVDVTSVGSGPMPEGFIAAYAYWYQDFHPDYPLMDPNLGNLADAPVAGSTWLCDQ